MPEPADDPVPGGGVQRTTSARAQAVVAVLLAALGFAAVTQVRSNSTDASYTGQREQDLVVLLDGLAEARTRAQTEITALEQTRAQLETSSSQRQTALRQAQQEADTLDILAGLVPVTGPGVQITIQDPDGTVGTDILLDAVEELRTAGAEAMSFNGKVRVVAQTSFEDTAGGVRIDGTTLSPPYTIDVIGEPHELEGALTFPEGPEDDVAAQGGTLTVTSQDRLRIDAVVSAGTDRPGGS